MVCFACCAEGEGEAAVVAVLDPGAESAYAAADGAETRWEEAPQEEAKPAATHEVPNPVREDRKPGKLCMSRMPKEGDWVMCLGGKKVGHDNAGVPKRFVLNPRQAAEVMEVDEDGDFRLRADGSGIESGFLFRSEFVYVQEPDEDKQEALVPAHMRSPSLVDKNDAGPVPCDNNGIEKSDKEDKLDLSLHSAWFEVPLKKNTPEDKFGLHLDTIDEKAFEVINVVGDGLVQAYNEKAPEGKKVLPGCFVMGMNGVSRKKDVMLELLSTQTSVKLVVAPRTVFTVQLAKPTTGPLGMNLTYEEKCASMLYLGAAAGSAVENYNKTAEDGQQVLVGDRVIEVNEVSGSPMKMLEEVKGATHLTMKVARAVS